MLRKNKPVILKHDSIFDDVSKTVEYVISLLNKKIPVIVVLTEYELNGGPINSKADCPVAAINNVSLMFKFVEKLYPLCAAQILVMKNTLITTKESKKLKNTIESILKWGAVPVVGENRAISCESFGKQSAGNFIASWLEKNIK